MGENSIIQRAQSICFMHLHEHLKTYIQEKTIIQKDTCTPMFIAELFAIAKTQKQPKCPLTDEWIKM